VKLVGYNDKLHPLMAMMMTKMKEFQVDPRRFEVIKENVSRC
jgi:secreted Zn-dependent insulinase-like peptidase